MDVKPGYKQTEVGFIPNDWGTYTLLGLSRQIMDYRGRTPKKLGMDWGGGDIPALSAGNVKMGFVDFSAECYFGSEALYGKWMGQGDVAKDDILFTTEAPLGNVALVPDERKYILSQRTILLKPRQEIASSKFLFQLLLSDEFQRMLKDYSSGSTAKGIQRKKLEQLFVAVPPLSEQYAIARALSDVDALLDSLDRLIAKKRNLKQAAMQQLLTGQTRLPGFSGEWEEKRLGDLGVTYGGLTGKTKADFGNGEARYITFMNVMQNVVIDSETFDRVEVSQIETQNRARKGDLFFNGSSETPEEVALCAVLLYEVQDVYLNSFCFGFRFREDVAANGIFFAYYLRGPVGRELMKSLAQGSTRYNLSKVALLNSSLLLPTPLEQAAIAEVLTGMDTELVSLEQRRNKTAALKQGMMQELLTGRTRLL